MNSFVIFIYCGLGIKTGSGGCCCHNARRRMRNRKSNPEGVSPRDLTYCSHKPECIETTNPERSVLITIIIWMLVFSTQNTNIVLEARAVSRATPIITSLVPLHDGNCRLKIPVVKGRCACDALPHAVHIGVFKFVKTISTAIKHIYQESANIIEGCNVALDTNDCWNFQ